ncbi:MAG: arginine repressor, partial [Chloroflexi bacterium]|nr:arginine repressor [Chloroflexota bacterium]
LIKVGRGGVQAYALPSRVDDREISGEERLRQLLRGLPLEIRQSGLLLVVKTIPGSAHAIASALDRAQWREVAGSLAGDDTLFIAVADRTGLQRLWKRLLRLAG